MKTISTNAAVLGEGPFWFNQQLYWVDITSKQLYTLKNNEQQKVLHHSEGLTAVVPHQQGGFVFSSHQQVIHLDSQGNLNPLTNFDLKNPGLRFNDGKCDSQGRFWVGSMDCHESEYLGSLYVFDQGKVHKVLDKICISNGLCWNADLSLFYFIDSAKQSIEVFDFDSQKIKLTNRRTLYKIPDEHVYPDGMCIDRNGNLWVALWNGHGVICIDAVTGAVLQKLELPCRKATSCCFGGENLDELYVTTDSRDEDLSKYPLSGHVFKFQLDVLGLAAETYKA